ncbi:MAG: hypothetical protein ACQESN_03520 [Thermotogota bacterium]
MSDIYISARAKNFGEHKKNYYLKNNFEYKESLEMIIKKAKKIKDVISALKFNMKRNEFSDFIILDDDNNFISDDENKDIFLFDILEKPEEFKELIIKANKEVFNRRAKITELINELQYDYMIQINPWYKHSKARLYISQDENNDTKLGHIDLFGDNHYIKNNSNLFKSLIQDKRVIIISKFYKISEGLN